MRPDIRIVISPATPARTRAAFAPLTLGPLIADASIDPTKALVIRHALAQETVESGPTGLHADSTHSEILEYIQRQSADTRRFPAIPPLLWVVFINEGGDQARLWSVLEHRSEVENNGIIRTFDADHMADLRKRLMIGWRAPRSWWINATPAARYPVMDVVDAEPIPFLGFDWLVLSHVQLQAVMREHCYASWRTAPWSAFGICIITGTRVVRH